MFLLMRILCGLTRPPLRNTRTQPAPRAGGAGSHCPTVRLDHLKSCEAMDAQSREKGKTQSGSLVRPHRGGHMPTQPEHYTSTGAESALFFSFFRTFFLRSALSRFVRVGNR